MLFTPFFRPLCLLPSPAQVILRQDYTKASDVYAFGLILWELLTWELPYSNMSVLQVGAWVWVHVWCVVQAARHSVASLRAACQLA